MIVTKAGIDLEQAVKTAEQQCRADQRNNSERNFGNHQNLPDRPSPGGCARAVLQRRVYIDSSQLKRRNHAAPGTAKDAYHYSESQDRDIQSDVLQRHKT